MFLFFWATISENVAPQLSNQLHQAGCQQKKNRATPVALGNTLQTLRACVIPTTLMTLSLNAWQGTT